MINNISLLIHGPIKSSNLSKIDKSVRNTKIHFSEVVFVIYKREKDSYLKALDGLFTGCNCRYVFIKDLINPGFANVNRQIHSVKNGLEIISNSSFVIKLRNDQSVNFDKLFSCIEKYSFFKETEKLLTTCSFTRKDRYYHPSDMFICGYAHMLKKYYALSLQKETHVETEMIIKEMYERSNHTLSYSPISPESILFRDFLKRHNWNFKETKEDSYQALKKYFYFVNAWDIDYVWMKKRTYPFKKEKELILPHFYTISPFPGAPIENVSCFFRHEFCGKMNLKDCYYICKSYILWSLWLFNKRSLSRKVKYYFYRAESIFFHLIYYFFILVPYVLAKDVLPRIDKKISKYNLKCKNLR